MNALNLRAFLTESPFARYLERCWDGTCYLNFPAEEQNPACDPATNAHSLLYLVYACRLKLGGVPARRTAQLALWLAGQVEPNGLIRERDGVTDHPACSSQIADALATAAFYTEDSGLEIRERETVIAAFRRILECNHRIRYPEGAQGKTQQLRFELRVYYWAWQLSGSEEDRRRFFLALENGLHRYTHAAAIDGPLLQPSLNADWTWNYICTGGLTHEHATNTHTPAYYCTEPQGFLFILLRGWATGAITQEPEQQEFCRRYILGLFRNLSRAGHLSSDLDGYGIHRAWFGPVLIEGLPLEAAAAATQLGLPEETAGWLRWYVGRFLDFVRRGADYASSGLPEAQPYGHRIGIEAQFSRLAGTRLYASVARALAEFGSLEELEQQEPPAYATYAPDAQWLRVSTPTYETSFAGYTCLRNIPVVKNYGDPHLGSLIGGAPLTTLFSGNELLAVASFPVASLWHIEVDDHNGRRRISCATGPEDEIALSIRTPQGEILDRLSANPYDAPVLHQLTAQEWVGVNWLRKERSFHCDFYVHNRYYANRIELDWGMRGMAGHYYDQIAFIITLPQEGTECLLESTWQPLLPGILAAPRAIRWRRGSTTCQMNIETFREDEAEGKSVWLVAPLSVEDGNPGGRNGICPFPLMQLRLEIIPSIRSRIWRMRNILSFSEMNTQQ